jgi:SHS2 domain-containing protein
VNELKSHLATPVDTSICLRREGLWHDASSFRPCGDDDVANFSFSEDKPGEVRMEILAAEQLELFNAAATALCLYMWDQEAVEERESVALGWYGFNERTALAGLLSELLFRMDAEGWVFKRFVTEHVEEVDTEERLRRRQLSIRGHAYGERFDPARHRLIRPVRAVQIRGLKLTGKAGSFCFQCLLDA